MDTGNYMSNQIDDLVTQGLGIKEEFDKWLYDVCEIKAGKHKDPHDILPTIDLTDAKLSFLDEMSAEEYSKTI